MANGSGTGPGAKLFTFLSGIGEGISDIVDPHAEERKETVQFLMENPEMLRQFSEEQEEAEAGQRQQAQEAAPSASELQAAELQRLADAGTPAQLSAQESPNVLAGLPGFEGRGGEARRLLRSAPPRSPQQRVEQETALEQERQGLPEAQVEAEVAEAGATTATSRFQERLAEGLDVQTAIAARNMEDQLQVELGEEQIEALGQLREFREEARQSGDLSMMRIIDAALGDQPEIAQALMQRERLTVQERLARLRAATDREEVAAERLKLRLDIEDQIEEGRDRVRELLNEQPEGWKEMMGEEVASLNRTRQAVRRVFPETTTFFTGIKKGWLGGLGIEVDEIPVFTENDQAQDALDVIEQQASSNPEVGEQELFQSKGFRSLMNMLPSGDPRRGQVREYVRDLIQQKMANLEVDEETGNPVFVVPVGPPGTGQVHEIPVEEAMQMTEEFFDAIGEDINEFFRARQGESPRTIWRRRMIERETRREVEVPEEGGGGQ